MKRPHPYRWRVASAASTLGALIVASAAITVVGCGALRRPVVPMPVIALGSPAAHDCLVILLPGRWNRPEAFADAGFARAVAARGLSLDLVAVDAHLGYYRNRSVIERLRADVVLPARAAGAGRSGYDRVWLAGVSLGGLGSLLYLRDHPDDLAGVLALAPFLGEPEVIRELEVAGGPLAWQPPPALDGTLGRELWSWLAPWLRRPSTVPLHLGYGEGDDLAPANRLLAGALPSGRVYTAPGGHDWPTWLALWEQFLDRERPCAAVR